MEHPCRLLASAQDLIQSLLDAVMLHPMNPNPVRCLMTIRIPTFGYPMVHHPAVQGSVMLDPVMQDPVHGLMTILIPSFGYPVVDPTTSFSRGPEVRRSASLIPS